MPVHSAEGLRRHYRGFNDITVALAGADPSATLVAAKTGHTIYVQRLEVVLTTTAAQNWIFRDTAGTPIVLAVLPNSSAVARHLLVDSEQGIPLTEGKALDLLASAAGLAGQIHVEGYWKQTAPLSKAAAAAA
jgi:hypothetical protein